MNKSTYWLMAIPPVLGLFMISKFYGSIWFAISIVGYLVYRVILDYYRLVKLGKIDKKDRWKFFIPFHPIRLRKLRHVWFG